MLSIQQNTDDAQLVHFFHRLTCRRLLLLEPNPTLAESIETVLTPRRYNVTTVTNGPDALTAVMRHKDFEVILCDMDIRHPPGMMFYRAVNRVRQELCERFIFMTGPAGGPEADAFIRSVNGISLWKPFETHVLLETIELSRHRVASAERAVAGE